MAGGGGWFERFSAAETSLWLKGPVGAACGAHGLGPTSCVTTTVAPRMQCPATVALVANLVGAVLSFTFIPVSTKGASAHDRAVPAGKPRLGRPARPAPSGTWYLDAGRV